MDLQQSEEEHDQTFETVRAAAAADRSEGIGQGSAASRTATRSLSDQDLIVRAYERAVLAVVFATVVALVVAIVMAFLGSRSGAVARAIVTVVTGAAMGFVLKQRNDARKRLHVRRRLRDKYCHTVGVGS